MCHNKSLLPGNREPRHSLKSDFRLPSSKETLTTSILSKCFCCSNESNQKAIRDRSWKVEIMEMHFYLRAVISDFLWLDSLEQQKHLERIEISISTFTHMTLISRSKIFSRADASEHTRTMLREASSSSPFLTASPGSVLCSRSNLLKRKDLCFSSLRIGLIWHRRSLRSSHLSSQVLPRFCRVTLEKMIF
jgi:hypothetical protein